ncbi:MAG: GNAT family N-acetyltransferase [Pseudomonadota bacterium]
MSADGTPRDTRGSPPQETASLALRTVSSIGEIAEAQWDRHAFPPGVPYNPFIAHRFLTLLEESGSIADDTGWRPNLLILEQGDDILGVAPAYLKGHSQGEYVFDHAWADAYSRAGGQYYPKLLIAAPFTPAPGPRLLCADRDHRPLLAGAIRQFTDQTGLSSVHINFITQAERTLLEADGYLARLGEQFHWANRGYETFDDFLAALASRKRKTIRQERRKATEQGIRIENITGCDLKEHHWDSFWVFYQDTGMRKWGTPYLTREAFSLLGERMADDLLLTLAYADGGTEPIAGALHFIGGDTLYGRYWGCTEQAKFLHFECCYYQAIEYAITAGLARVEAGAQGTHKLARGYEPVPTFSAHYLPDPNFREAVSRYLAHERHGVAEDIAALKNYTPYKKTV